MKTGIGKETIMRQLLFWKLGLIATASLILLTSVATLAENGRDFAGFYRLDEAVGLGEEVQVTLTFRVINYSDANLDSATVKLRDRTLSSTVYGSFTVGPLGDRESARLTGTFTVPCYEYEYWQMGGVPFLSLEFTDAAGNPVNQMIDLAPSFGGEV
jgi:hypothetical protein